MCHSDARCFSLEMGTKRFMLNQLCGATGVLFHLPPGVFPHTHTFGRELPEACLDVGLSGKALSLPFPTSVMGRVRILFLSVHR